MTKKTFIDLYKCLSESEEIHQPRNIENWIRSEAVENRKVFLKSNKK